MAEDASRRGRRRRAHAPIVAAAFVVLLSLVGSPVPAGAAEEAAAPDAPVRPATPGPEEGVRPDVPGPASPPTTALARVPVAVVRTLEEGARTEGAWGLVKALERVLDDDPSLVATPPRAAALATVAARLAQDLPDADADHRETVEVLILAYAPPSQRADVAARVAAALEPPPPPAPAPAPAREDGVRLGSFRLHPALVVSELYDDNIFATRSDEEDDFVTHVTPSFLLRSDWQRHGLSFDAGGDFAFYDDNGDENTQDAWVGADGHLDLAEDTVLFGGARYAREHEDRASPDDVNGDEPTRYYETEGYLGLEQRIDRWSFRLGGTVDRLDFRDVSALVGELDNDDRDRTMTTGGLRVGYRLGDRIELFGQAAWDGRSYDRSRDDFGFDRDSDGVRLLAGLAFAPRADLWIAAFGGYLGQDYDDPLLDDVDTGTFGLELEWSPLERTWITVFVDRFLDETTLPGASSDLVTRVGATLEHEITERVEGRMTLSWAQDDYRGISRSDDVYYASAGLRFDLGHHLFVAPEYRFVHRDSNVFTEDYTRSQVWLALGMDFPVAGQPRRRTRALRALAPPPGAEVEVVPFRLGGPYLGVQVAHGGLLTDLEGPRRMGTSELDASFGDLGGAAGLFAGWGARWRCLYLGLELEGEIGEAEWHHEGDETRRVFSLRRTWGWSGALRAGVVLRDAALLYVRGGPAWARFENEYVLAPDDIDESHTETGYRVGVGLEAPITASLFVRGDHVFSDYGSWNVDYTGASDVFAPRETMTRLGVGMRFGDLLHDLFGGGERPAPRAAPVDWSGPYVGGLLGHGVLGANVTGVREGGGAFDADFADHGFSGGLFAGWGHRWAGWYLGGELGGEASWADWSHDRSFFGRDFAVEQKYDIEAAVRLGRVLQETALFYVKAGGARSRFQTTYLRDVVFVEQDDSRNGWRVGAGLEVAASDRTFVRLEWDYTSYSSYEVDYGDVEPDAFDPSSSRARLAVGLRF